MCIVLAWLGESMCDDGPGAGWGSRLQVMSKPALLSPVTTLVINRYLPLEAPVPHHA